MNDIERETILVVDDVADNIAAMAEILGAEYRVTFATTGTDALEMAQSQPQPSLILLDLVMPAMDGHEVCRRLKADLRTRDIPVIFITALSDAQSEEVGLKLGGVDYLHRPCHPAIVLQRVRIHLDLHNQNVALERRVRDRTSELERARMQIVQRLARAGEYRDNATGMHVTRMSHYCHRLGLAAGIPAATADLLLAAASMHDIGKIGIPDRILLKPGRLDDAERLEMQRHTLIGAEIIGNDDSDLLSLARSVALTHHERWDGDGYPNRLRGADIPIEGRIAAICDVFDALTSERPYKEAWEIDDACKFISGESGKAFDPDLVAIFNQLRPAFEDIRMTYADRVEEFDPGLSFLRRKKGQDTLQAAKD